MESIISDLSKSMTNDMSSILFQNYRDAYVLFKKLFFLRYSSLFKFKI